MIRIVAIGFLIGTSAVFAQNGGGYCCDFDARLAQSQKESERIDKQPYWRCYGTVHQGDAKCGEYLCGPYGCVMPSGPPNSNPQGH